MTIYEVKSIRNVKVPAEQQKVEQDFYAVDGDSIQPLLEYLDTDIRSSNVKILGIVCAFKIAKHIK